MPRRTVEFDAILRLKIRDAGQRNVKYTAEVFVSRRDLDRIRELILATGFDDVNVRDIKDLKKKGGVKVLSSRGYYIRVNMSDEEKTSETPTEAKAEEPTELAEEVEEKDEEDKPE